MADPPKLCDRYTHGISHYHAVMANHSKGSTKVRGTYIWLVPLCLATLATCHCDLSIFRRYLSVYSFPTSLTLSSLTSPYVLLDLSRIALLSYRALRGMQVPQIDRTRAHLTWHLHIRRRHRRHSSSGFEAGPNVFTLTIVRLFLNSPVSSSLLINR